MAKRPTKPTIKKEDKFLAELRKMPNVSRACRLSGLNRSHAYELRDNDARFAAAWDDALDEGIELLEETATERAKSGSDTLMIFLLKAHRPEKYRDNAKLDVEVSGNIEHKIHTIEVLKTPKRNE